MARGLSRHPDTPVTTGEQELLQYGPQWVRLGLEIEGKVASAKEQGIERVIAGLVQGNQITSAMVEHALTMVRV